MILQASNFNQKLSFLTLGVESTKGTSVSAFNFDVFLEVLPILFPLLPVLHVQFVAGDAEKIDAAIQSSVQDQVSQFLDIIKSKSGLTFEEIALRIGYTPSYLASLKQKNKIPSFKIWNQLKSIAVDPTMELEKLSPNFDIIRKNILLRA